MLDISSPLTVSHAHAYYLHQLGQTYLIEYLPEWHGKLADKIGLTNPVGDGQFTRLMEGRCPRTGEMWLPPRHNPDGMRDKRAAFDFCFNSPKSVSIVALVGGDRRLVDAHSKAVRAALDAIEPHVQAALGGNRGTETTGKWAAAIFLDDLARPVDGYRCVHLHSHCVVANMTEDADGQARALEPHALFNVKSLATEIYRTELAMAVRRLGYDVEYREGVPEIKGIPREYMRQESLRAEEIRQEARSRRGNDYNPKFADIVAHQVRADKTPAAPAATRAAHRKTAAAYGNPAMAVVERAVRARHMRVPAEHPELAFRAVEWAKQRLSERNAVFSEAELQRDTLRWAAGRIPLYSITREIERQARTRELIAVDHVKPRSPGVQYTTPALIADERYVIEAMLAGKGKLKALSHASDEALQKRYPKLGEHQRKVALGTLANRDRIFGINGAAGVGKTFIMGTIQAEMEREGWKVIGLAPTSGAARALRDAGITKAETIQGFLLRERKPAKDRTVFVLDESSLAATRQVRGLIEKLQPHERVIICGDFRQHSSVEAGRAFLQLQLAGMNVSRINKLVRQQDEPLKKVVEALARGRANDAIAILEGQNRVHAISGQGDRYRAIARRYAANPEGTLVVSPDNSSRISINYAIRDEMKAAGHIGKEDVSVLILQQRRQLTRADLQLSYVYHPGNVVQYRRGSKTLGLPAKSFATVVGSHYGYDRTLTVKSEAGKFIRYNPERLSGVTLYSVCERRFSRGDRVQFTAPNKEKGIANRDLGTVSAISKQVMRVKMDTGKEVRLDLRENHEIDHGYVSTSHAAQGQTVEHVLVNIEAGNERVKELVNQTFAYTAVSRARISAEIFTDDASKLGEALSRHNQNSTALSARQAMEYSAS